MSDQPDPSQHEAYLRGVDALLEDRLDEALEELTAPADAGNPEAALALAKVHLRRAQGREATRRLTPLLSEPRADVGLHAYLLMLLASASALEKRTDDALRLLDEAGKLDPRMEHAARALRRRIEKGREPDVRF